MQKPDYYQGNHPFLFVSYAHRDAEQVWPIISRLQENGYRVWYDGAIVADKVWDDTIADKISDCCFFICFLSKTYVLSENCTDELRYALEQKKDILQIFLEDAQLPSGLKMRLSKKQAILWHHYPEQDGAFAKLEEVDGFSRARLSPTAHLTADELYAKAQQLRSTAAASAVLEAEGHIRRAAELGHPEAMRDLGLHYQYDRTDKDIKKAVYWYRCAAREGLRDAQFYLGELYLSGDDLPKDEAEALHWYHLAADQGHTEAQIKLGDIYYYGQDAQQDIPAALEWYRKAAHPEERWASDPMAGDAQHILGQRYEELGDLEQARYWYSMALKNGNIYSMACLQTLNEQ